METAILKEDNSRVLGATLMSPIFTFSGETKDAALKRALLHTDPFLDPEKTFLNHHPYEYPRREYPRH
jgi:hypothetical protein